MRQIKAALAGLLSLFAVSAAVAQSAPANMGYQTVYGRLGAAPGDTGPGQAIPFATLLAQMGAVPTSRTVSTTAPLTGGGSLASNLTLGITKSAFTATNDTNVTAVLGGTPSQAVLFAMSFTLGWSGQLSIARGGTGQATQQAGFEALAPTPTRAGDLMYWNGSHYVTLPGNNSGTQALVENASGVPSWATVAGTGTVTSVTCFGSAITTTGTCAIAATKSDQQTGTSTTAVVTPSQAQSHDSGVKAWVTFAGATGVINSSYNVASVTRVSAGLYTIVWTTAFVSYQCQVTSESSSGAAPIGAIVSGSKTTSQIQVETLSVPIAAADAVAVDVMCSGRQ